MSVNKKLGKCPFCDDGYIEVRRIEVNAKPTKLYACSNAHWEFEHDMCELSTQSSCSYRIFANQFLQWNKKSIGENEIRTVLEEEQVKIRLYSSRVKKEYYKWAILDKEYGLSIVWDIDIQEDDK
ncbi:hypothetical protein JHD50_04920 [Sulfurimonas sp. MAG313]|nr:hypothetical protein [Sulfurimonas sp. MAG313]MDF1880651.1 hypothetical protein [Sulfurimonas sp. MAG313]